MNSVRTLCTWVILIALVVSTRAVVAGDTDGTTDVRSIRKSDNVLLHASDTAAALGWEAKVTATGKLLTLCRDGNDGYCVPVRLEETGAAETDEGWFVGATTLAAAMRFEWSIDERGAHVRPGENASTERSPDLPAYNAEWGEGRGFQVGQTLPDIPLYDLSGGETRFAAFLGKQYIIYCWASW